MPSSNCCSLGVLLVCTLQVHSIMGLSLQGWAVCLSPSVLKRKKASNEKSKERSWYKCYKLSFWIENTYIAAIQIKYYSSGINGIVSKRSDTYYLCFQNWAILLNWIYLGCKTNSIIWEKLNLLYFVGKKPRLFVAEQGRKNSSGTARRLASEGTCLHCLDWSPALFYLKWGLQVTSSCRLCLY